MLSTRRPISETARREKVISRIRRGSTPVQNQVGHTMGQCVRLTRSGSGDDKQWRGCVFEPSTVLDGPPLLGIQFGEVVGRHL